MIRKIGARGIVLWVAYYPNRWKSLKGQNFFFVTQCYIHSDDLSLVIYIGEKMIEQFEFGVINWYNLRGRTVDKSTSAYRSVQNIGWKKSGNFVTENCWPPCSKIARL